jgi:MFS family permease
MKRSPMTIIFLTIFIDLVGFGMILPLSPFYAEHFGASPFQVGMLQASFSLMQFIMAPVWGRISDRIGRRPVMLMSLLGSAISYFTFASAQSLAWLFGARIFQGLFGANFGVAQACVADLTTEKDRAKGMGMVGAAFGLGFIFGPFIGAQLSHISLGFPAVVAGSVCFLNFIAAIFRLPETLSPENRKLEAKKTNRFQAFAELAQEPKIAKLIFVFFLCTFALANMESTLALFTERKFQFGVRQTGELFAVVGILMAFTQGYLIRKLIPKIGERKMLLWGPFLAAIGFFGIILMPNYILLGAIMAFVAVGTGITNPPLLGSISLLSSQSKQGTVMGVTQSISSLARVLGPLCGGFVFNTFGSNASFVVAAAVSALGGLMILSMYAQIPIRPPSGFSACQQPTGARPHAVTDLRS